MKVVNRLIAVSIVCLVLFSCAPAYNVHKGPVEGQDLKLDKSATVYVAVPDDHTSSGHLYSGSGKEVSSEVEFLFFKHVKNVIVARSVEDFDTALNSANEKSCDYLVFPNLIQWEDYSTEWNAIPDRLKLKVSIVDVNSGNVIEKILIEGKGKIMTFGGDHPMDIAKKPLKHWIDSLF